MIGNLYWDDAVFYVEQAGEFEREAHCWQLDITAAGVMNKKGYDSLRRTLTSGGKPGGKVMVPKTEAEIKALIKERRGESGV